MLNDIYNTKILEYAGNIARVGRLNVPENASDASSLQASAKAHSKLCGSTIIVDLEMKSTSKGLTVSDFAHEVKACALGQAAASIMAKTVIGATATELRTLRSIVYAMLKENGAAPTGKFDEFKFLEAVRDYKTRHASTLLTFDAVVDCIDKIENQLEAV